MTKASHGAGSRAASAAGQPRTLHTPAQPIDPFCPLDDSPHHQQFQYFASTSNPSHLPPSAIDMIGKSDQTHHQDDLKEFWAAVDSGNIPAVSDLKAVRAEDGRVHNSSPLDEQRFLVETINRLERTSEWDSTAVAILWDHSDGWSRGPPVPRSSDGRARLTSETRAVYAQFTPR